jgi:hypothetical protein
MKNRRNLILVQYCTFCGGNLVQPVLAPHGHAFCDMGCHDRFVADKENKCCIEVDYYRLCDLEW